MAVGVCPLGAACMYEILRAFPGTVTYAVLVVICIQCRGHSVTVTILPASMRNFFLTSLKTEIPETRANGWTSSEARGLWVALLLELVVSCLLYCSKGTVVITTL